VSRLVFLGTPDIAVPSLDALVDAGHDVVLVVSRPDARRGRGKQLSPSPVKEAALRLGLPVSDDLAEVAGCGAELGVVVAYGRLIPTSLLDEVAMVNIHFSLLPRWRGAAPLERAILAGDAETGVCLMAVAPELDTGGVYATAKTTVGDKSLSELRAELADLGAELLVEALAAGVTAMPEPVEQSGEITYATKISPGELEIALEGTVDEALRTIRLGRAFTSFEGRRLRILEARRSGDGALHPAGTLDGVTLSLGDGRIDLVRVQPESRAAMVATDWRRGLAAGLLELAAVGSPRGSGT
jgi:methionyl-tRNA formyltransferase